MRLLVIALSIIAVVRTAVAADRTEMLHNPNAYYPPANPHQGPQNGDGVVIKAREPAREQRRHIREIRQKAGMVFQQFNLFPHMTVLGNIIEAPTTVKGVSKSEATEKAEELLKANPDWFMPQQFENPDNPRVHYETTAPELWEQLNGDVACFVAGVGSGGTVGCAGSGRISPTTSGGRRRA